MRNNRFFIVVFGFVLFLLMIGIVFSIDYVNSKSVFDAEIDEVYIKGLEYYVNLDFDNIVDDVLKYDVEIVYVAENLVVSSDKFSCSSSCVEKIKLRKVFFGKYVIKIRAKYKNIFYEKKLNFKLEDTDMKSYDLELKPVYYLDNESLVVDGKIISYFDENVNYQFEVYPKSSRDTVDWYDFDCKGDCDFSFIINSQIVLDEYFINVYSEKGEQQFNFEIKIYDENYRDDSDSDKDDDDKDNDKYEKVCSGIKDNKLKKLFKDFFKDSNEKILNECEFEAINVFLQNRSFEVSGLPEQIIIGEKFEFEVYILESTLITQKDLLLPENFKFLRGTRRGFKVQGKVFNLKDKLEIIDKVSGYTKYLEIAVLKSQDIIDVEERLNVFVEEFVNKSNGKKDIVFSNKDSQLKFRDVNVESISRVEFIDKNSLNNLTEEEMDKVNTNIINVNAVGFSNATVVLEKKSSRVIEKIMTCSDFVNNLCLTGWFDSGFEFSQNRTHLWFDTVHFSAYMGIGPTYVFNVDFLDYTPRFIYQNASKIMDVYVTCDNTGDCGTINVTLYYFVLNLTDFSDFETGLGNWVNVATDQADWVRDQDNTPSNNCGPGMSNQAGTGFDHTLGTTSGWYLYYETSNPTVTGDMAYFESLVINSKGTISLDYWYHMGAVDGPTMTLEYLNRTVWTQLWTTTGNLGDTWFNNNFNFKYFGDTKFRLTGVKGASWASDVSLDDINITTWGKQIVGTSSAPLWIMDSVQKQVTLNQNQNQVVSFNLNVTGNAGQVVRVYAIAEALSDASIVSQSDDLNVTIAESVPPSGFKISPSNFTSTGNISLVFIANATDNVGLDSAILYIWNSVDTLVYSEVVDLDGVVFFNFNFTYDFTQSGDYTWNVKAIDTSLNEAFLGSNWTFSIDFPYLTLSYIDHTNPFPIKKGFFKALKANIDCLGSNCGDINVSVYYKNFSSQTFNDFENLEAGFGNWVVDGGSCDWTRNQDITTSAGTGPGGNAAGTGFDHTLGATTGWYAYVEASGNACQGGDTSADLTGTSFTSGSVSTNISFWYHIIGTNVGTLHLDVFSGGTWDLDVWSMTGSQQTTVDDPFNNVVVDLSSYSGIINTRFRYDGVTGWSSDMTLDDISIIAYSESIDDILIPIFSSNPLWTNATNSQLINLNQDESQVVTFYINATGNVADRYETFVDSVINSGTGVGDTGSLFNITITDPSSPTGNKTWPLDGASLIQKDIIFNVSVQDDNGLKDAKLYVWNSIDELVYTRLINLSGVLASNFSFGYNFTQADIYTWNVEVSDIGDNIIFLGSDWTLSISFPYLDLNYLNFSDPFQITQYFFKPLKVNVTCLGSNCFDINVSLHYFDYSSQVFNDFENLETGFGNWSADGGSCTWIRNQDITPSVGTGPGGNTNGAGFDHTIGDATGWYAFVETSANVCQGGDLDAILTGTSFITGTVNTSISFWYQMFGADMGTLHLDVFNGSVWNADVWSVVGNQQVTENSPFINAVVDLSSYSGTINTRFRYDGVTGFAADVAIDDFNISTYSQSYDNLFIPLLSSNPLWTNSSNPQTISLNQDESQIVTFYINATGVVYDEYEAYVDSIINAGNGVDKMGELFNISITGVPFLNFTTDFYNFTGVIASYQDGVTIIDLQALYAVHNNVNITCVTGNCSVFSHDFINGATLQSDTLNRVEFICSPTVSGVFNALFNVTSNEYFKGDLLNLSCSATELNLFLTLYSPDNILPYEVVQNTTFDISFNVTCNTVGGCPSVETSLFYTNTSFQAISYFENLEAGFGNWGTDGGTCDWTRNQDITASVGTGPGGNVVGTGFDHTLDTTSGWYAYVETSGTVCEGGDIDAILTGTSFTAGTVNTNISFWYHMIGANMGTLHLDVFNGVTWDADVWSIAGTQQITIDDPFVNVVVDLSSYSGIINTRFRYDGVTGWAADVVIDDIDIVTYSEINNDVLIPVISSDPFWTSLQNPQTINLNRGESKIVSFMTNATGVIGLTESLYGILNNGIDSQILDVKIIGNPIINLVMNKNISRLGNDFFNVNLLLVNLDLNPIVNDKDIVIYSFIPNFVNVITPFVYSNSNRYSTVFVSENLTYNEYNGSIYQWTLSNKTINSIFGSFYGSNDVNNSWSLNFNVSCSSNYNYKDMILVGFDPVK